jgi:microcystin degradation protein MlrC
MTYEVIRPMVFCLSGDVHATGEIPAGTIVSSLSFAQMRHADADACKQMAKRHRRKNPSRRLVFFEWRDRPRSGVIGDDLLTTRRRPE